MTIKKRASEGKIFYVSTALNDGGGGRWQAEIALAFAMEIIHDMANEIHSQCHKSRIQHFDGHE
jgi:hypothetical protein